jgi:O-antigen/teichoic acid export membrane protein
VTNAAAASAPTSHRVARNVMIMMLGQVLGMPLAMLINIFMGRRLGPGDYGQYYLLTTFATLAFLFVDWGQSSILPARIANDRSLSGRYLGSALFWTLCGSLLAIAAMLSIFGLRSSSAPVLLAVTLVCVSQAFLLLAKTCADAVRGFERNDISARMQFGTQFASALFVIPVLLLGGGLLSCLVAIAVAALLVLIMVLRSLRGAGIGRLCVDTAMTRSLLQAGTSFLILNLVLYLQPSIDAYFLNRYASAEAVGWYAASRKLINPLLFPASALVSALYPTLCRLWTQDVADYARTARGALRAAIVITVPLSVGCAVFARLGIELFNADKFGPAQDNLRTLSIFLFLVYLSMVLGTSLNAAGKQRRWSIVQLGCIVVSLVLDPWLVPWFQLHAGNGGLGVSIATVASETLMLIAGIVLLPRGIIDRASWRCVLQALVAGGAMAACALALPSFNQWFVALLSVAVYAAVLYAVGGLPPDQLALLRSLGRRNRAGSESVQT